MSTLSDIYQGIATVIGTAMGSFGQAHAYSHPVHSVNEFPAFVVLPASFDPEIAFGGNSIEGKARIIVLVSSIDSPEGFQTLYDILDPTEAGKSVIKALRDAPTFGGKVDSSRVGTVSNIGQIEVFGGFYYGAEIEVEFVK